MRLPGWLKKRGVPPENAQLLAWRRMWTEAASSPEADRIEQLAAELESFGLPDEEVEIEREMLDALRDRAALAAAIREAGLPTVETGHRIVGSESCHYTAPASMPDEPGQPGGRLLFTSGRAVFAGAGARTAAAWHIIAEARQIDRDVVLIRADREQLYRFRCNSFSDALCGALIARELVASRRRARPGL